MSPENLRIAFFLAYAVCYGALVVASISFVRWRRKTKWPFKDEDKLLRGPGEGLRRRILEIDERVAVELFGTIMIGLIVGPLAGWTAHVLGLTAGKAFIAIVAALAAIALLSAWRMTKLWQNRSNAFLGWFGERVVAEKLQPLEQQGYRIFHDLPCKPGKKGFNIDHVVVGPTGVTVVEVKTRRKGNARPGYKDHEVIFNGTQLDWPWGYDRDAPQQALNEADWLGKWIFERTGLRSEVRGILALPGWFVRESPSPALRVVNPNFLPDAVRGRGENRLTPQQVDLISRQLDLLCRDVED